jgi:ribA/ribD-fused uncharacterized protein
MRFQYTRYREGFTTRIGPYVVVVWRTNDGWTAYDGRLDAVDIFPSHGGTRDQAVLAKVQRTSYLREALKREPIRSFRGEHTWLSNFFRVDVVLDGVTYRSVEHALQAAKTLDPDERGRVTAVVSPVIAKGIGKKVTLRPGWDALRLEVMRDLLRQKFDPGTPLAEKLLATGDAHLEEGNRWGDRFWGTVNGEGANHLGKLLMEVRKKLKGATLFGALHD